MRPLLLALLLLALPLRAAAATVQINRFDDPSPPPSSCTDRDHLDCSLRGAIQAVENDAGLDRTIHVPEGIYPLTQGVLLLFNDVKLVGSGAASTMIDALGADRVMVIVFDETIEVSGVTLTRGNTVNGDGAGILNLGTLTLTDVVVRDSTSHGLGGGLSNVRDEPLGYQGVLTLVRTTFVGNRGRVGGGAISNDGGTITATDCVLDGNTAAVFVNGSGGSGAGGGIHNEGVATFTGCTFTRNGSGSGGAAAGFRAGSVLTFVNSTLSGNSAVESVLGGSGGALYLDQGAIAILKNATVTDNFNDGDAGGIQAPAGGVTLQNSIVAGNHRVGGTPSDCKGTLSSSGYNLIETTTDCTITGGANDLIGVDPMLAPLGDNGGATPTRALMAGSPALDAGNPAAPGSGGAACAAVDQRGVARPQGGRCDIGAFEYEPLPSSSTTTTTLPARVELCGDCLDNDGNQLTDLEDPACCVPDVRLALRMLQLTRAKKRVALGLLGTLAASPGPRVGDDVLVQLRLEGAPDFFCARIPAVNLVRRGNVVSFTDRRHSVASAGGIDALRFKAVKGGLTLRVAGGRVALPLPAAGTLLATVGLRDPGDVEASNRCSAVAAPLRARKGGLRFP